MLAAWSNRFEQALVAAMCGRLGVDSDPGIVAALIPALASREAPIDQFFFDWRGGRDPGADAYPSEPFRALAKALKGRERPQSHPYWSDAQPCSMHIDEVEAIWSAIAERDDWRPFEDKVNAVRRMGDALRADAPQD
jgi:hypothetical protein